MTKEKKVMVVLATVLMVLAAMGLVAARYLIPDDGGNGLRAMKRQAAWCGVGVVAAVVAAYVPWRVWMKGVVPLRKHVRIVCLVLGVCFGCWVSTNPVFASRIASSCGMESVVANLEYQLLVYGIEHATLEAAVDESEWIGESSVVTVKDIPHPRTSGVLFATAVRFGRLFPIGALVLFGVFAAGISVLACWSKDVDRRLFMLIYGALLTIPPLYCVGEGVCPVPLLNVCTPFIGFGWTSFLVAGLGFGALWSSLKR